MFSSLGQTRTKGENMEATTRYDDAQNTKLWSEFVRRHAPKQKWNTKIFTHSLNKEVIERLKTNLEVLKNLKEGEKLQSLGNKVLALTNLIWPSYPFNVGDLKDTVTHYIWVIRYNRIVPPTENIEMTVFSAQLQATSFVYLAGLRTLLKTYSQDNQTAEDLKPVIQKFEKKVRSQTTKFHLAEIGKQFDYNKSKYLVQDPDTNEQYFDWSKDSGDLTNNESFTI